MARHANTASARSRTRRPRRILSTLLIVAGLVLLAVAGALWGKDQWRYHKQAQINRKLASYVTLYDAPSDAPKPPDVDWAGLKAINADVVAWLQVPGTAVNYPVYQAEDNVRYLRASATAPCPTSTPVTCRPGTWAAAQSPMVPMPQYASSTRMPRSSPAPSMARRYRRSVWEGLVW